MAEDAEYIAALCQLTSLNADQLAGVDRLGDLSVDELDAFLADFDAAWEANRHAIQDAKDEVIDRRRAQAAIEVQIGEAARRRDPRHPVFTDDEIATLQAAREHVSEAKAALEFAGEQFKAGVTDDQLAAR